MERTYHRKMNLSGAKCGPATSNLGKNYSRQERSLRRRIHSSPSYKNRLFVCLSHILLLLLSSSAANPRGLKWVLTYLREGGWRLMISFFFTPLPHSLPWQGNPQTLFFRAAACSGAGDFFLVHTSTYSASNLASARIWHSRKRRALIFCIFLVCLLTCYARSLFSISKIAKDKPDLLASLVG